MIYTTKKCPYCKVTYQRHEANNYRFGSPIVTCKVCLERFIDKDRHEIALEEVYNEKQFNIGKCFFSAFFPCGLFSLICFILASLDENTLTAGLILGGITSILFFCIFFAEIKDIPCKIKIYKTEYEKSEKRLQNEDYIQALIALGYNIPTRYLLPKKQEPSHSETMQLKQLRETASPRPFRRQMPVSIENMSSYKQEMKAKKANEIQPTDKK